MSIIRYSSFSLYIWYLIIKFSFKMLLRYDLEETICYCIGIMKLDNGACTVCSGYVFRRFSLNDGIVLWHCADGRYDSF